MLEHLLGIGLEDDALAGPPAPRVHAGVEALGELGLVVVRVEFGPQVDVALRPSQRAEELADVLRLGVAVEHGGDHECVVDDLAEAQLLGEVVGPAEERAGRCLAI